MQNQYNLLHVIKELFYSMKIVKQEVSYLGMILDKFSVSQIQTAIPNAKKIFLEQFKDTTINQFKDTSFNQIVDTPINYPEHFMQSFCHKFIQKHLSDEELMQKTFRQIQKCRKEHIKNKEIMDNILMFKCLCGGSFRTKSGLHNHLINQKCKNQLSQETSMNQILKQSFPKRKMRQSKKKRRKAKNMKVQSSDQLSQIVQEQQD